MPTLLGFGSLRHCQYASPAVHHPEALSPSRGRKSARTHLPNIRRSLKPMNSPANEQTAIAYRERAQSWDASGGSKAGIKSGLRHVTIANSTRYERKVPRQWDARYRPKAVLDNAAKTGDSPFRETPTC
jgi:hypothetical protein